MEAAAVGTRVGSQVLFENSKVRVWDFTLEPGEWSEWHRHEHDYVIVYVTDAELGLEALNLPPEKASVSDGYASHTSVGSAADQRLTHRLGNLGDQRLRHLVIEILGPRAQHDTTMRIESNDPAEMNADSRPELSAGSDGGGAA